MNLMYSSHPPRSSDPQGKIGQILMAARELFLSQGYGNTSMDAVAKHAGVSKSTLYAHFENKEQLFGAVVGTARQRLHDALTGVSTTHERDIRKMLIQIGTQFMSYVTEPVSLTLFRVVIGEIQKFPELGREMYQSGNSVVVRTIADFFRQWTDAGLLQVEDTMLASRQFLGLVKGDLQFRCLMDIDQPATETDIKRNVESAVAMFLSHYGPKKV
jgi:TetR/AcrR family transcriptional repressor of mexJK operon